MKKIIIAGVLGIGFWFLAATKALEPAPPVTLRSVDGKVYSLSQFKGRLVFLTFFKEGCVPCKKEIPFLSNLAAKYPNHLMVLGVGFQEKDPARLQAVAAGFGARFPVLVDEQGLVARGYMVTSTPFGVLVDEKGYLVGKWFGFQPAELEADITGRVQRLMAEQNTKAIAVAALTEATEAAKKAGLGAKLQQVISDGLAGQGYAIAGAGQPSAYTIAGSVSKIGPITGVSITISQTSSRLKMEDISESLSGDNYDPLLKDITEKLKKLP